MIWFWLIFQWSFHNKMLAAIAVNLLTISNLLRERLLFCSRFPLRFSLVLSGFLATPLNSAIFPRSCSSVTWIGSSIFELLSKSYEWIRILSCSWSFCWFLGSSFSCSINCSNCPILPESTSLSGSSGCCFCVDALSRSPTSLKTYMELKSSL